MRDHCCFLHYLGVAVAAVNFLHLNSVYHQAPLPILVGPPHTNKSFLSKVCLSLVGGIHREAVYNELTPARMKELLSTSLFFVYNDPEKADIVKTLISKVRYT